MAAPAPTPAPDLPPTGRLAAGAHLFPVRVYYEDTDAGGIAYHASCLRWFERARTELVAVLGGERAPADGGFVVAALALRYLRPARLGDALVVRTLVARVRAAGLVVQQSVRRGDELLVDGEITLALIGTDGRPRRLAPAWTESLRALTGVCLPA